MMDVIKDVSSLHMYLANDDASLIWQFVTFNGTYVAEDTFGIAFNSMNFLSFDLVE